MRIGYVRVSSAEQNTARQEALMEQLGVDEVYIDRMSGKGVEFVSQKEAIDTSTPTGKFMLTVFAAIAELERDYIRQRQREGIEIAKAKGIYKGRKPIVRDNFDAVVALWRRGEITAVEAQRRLDMKPSTFYRKVKQV